MKKVLMTFLLTIAVMIPALSVEAADVPNFRQIDYSQIKFIKSESSEVLSFYRYGCDDVLYNQSGFQFASKYVQMLTKQYQFKLVKSSSDEYSKYYSLVYTGNKKVKFFDFDDVNCNLFIEACDDVIDIYIGKGLTYGG